MFLKLFKHDLLHIGNPLAALDRERLTAGCEMPSFIDSWVALIPNFLPATVLETCRLKRKNLSDFIHSVWLATKDRLILITRDLLDTL
jgi:hypothetical protein